MKSLILTICVLFVSSYSFAQPIAFQNAFPNLTFVKPVYFTYANDGTNMVYVVEQAGLIKSFVNDSTVNSVTNFLGIGGLVDASGNEMGLLGLAFHPDFANNRYFYVNYTAGSPRRTVIARYNTQAVNPALGDPASALILMEIAQPFSNHNGGMIMFGTDGYLYIGMGDGGSAGDPNGVAQNTQSHLGKFLRIDVDNPGGGNNYGIPNDNPFFGQPGNGLPEIYATGIRNPWRFSQDAVTGHIYAGDVGQGNWEEISVINNGGNYGWKRTEGFACYSPSVGCDTTGVTWPIKVYANAGADCSVTGGYVYRGTNRPELVGRYIYGDYCSGKIWKLFYNNGVVTEDALLLDATWYLISFGQDANNELYMVSRNTANNNGNVFRFNRVINVANEDLANTLINDSKVIYGSNASQLLFSLRSQAELQLEIIDISGKQILKKDLPLMSQGEYRIDLPGVKDGFSKGIYIVRLITEKETYQSKSLKYILH